MSSGKLFLVWIAIGFLILIFMPVTLFHDGHAFHFVALTIEYMAPRLGTLLQRSAHPELGLVYFSTMWMLVPVQVFLFIKAEMRSIKASRNHDITVYSQVMEKPFSNIILAFVLAIISALVLSGYLSLDEGEKNQLLTAKIYYPMIENLFFMPVLSGLVFGLMSMMIGRIVVIVRLLKNGEN